MNWLGLLVPFVYLTVLLGSLYTFSYLYRQRKLNAQLNLQPYFPPHVARNVYLTLLHQTDTQSDLKSVPNTILMSALLERAIEDIHRIKDIRTRKGPLNQLLQRGVVGDELWQRFLRAEQEMEAELKDVVSEANALASGWGAVIFQTASEMAVSRLTKQQVEQKRATLAKEKADWTATRESAQKELLNQPVLQGSSNASGSDGAAASKTEVNTVTTPERPHTATTTSSEDDAIVVETPDGRDGAPASNKKKKKNKK